MTREEVMKAIERKSAEELRIIYALLLLLADDRKKARRNAGVFFCIYTKNINKP